MANKKTSLTRKLVVALLILLAIPVLVWGFAHINRPATVTAYFWLEQKWVDHWPVERQKWEIQKLVPVMCRLGILAPVRVEVEPGVSFLLASPATRVFAAAAMSATRQRRQTESR